MASDYDYATKHKYRVEAGGEFVPGVTTAINVLDKPALKWSAAEIAARTALENHRKRASIVAAHREYLTKRRHPLANASDDEVYVHYCRGSFDREWRGKADRGTRVHDIAERWTRGETVEVEQGDEGFLDALEAFHRDTKPTFELVERVVINKELRYGGRFDAVAFLDGSSDFGLFIIDYKTGGHYPETVAMQLAAYMECELADYDGAGNLLGSHPLPSLDGARAVYLRQDGTYSLVDPFQTVGRDKAWRGFQACLELYQAMKEISGKERDAE